MTPSASLLALTRDVTPAISRCELTHLAREPIDHRRAVAQHQEYERLLLALGCRVERVPAHPDLADAVFIEDTAVVVEEVAVITRPGAESRRGETEQVAAALGRHRPLAHIEAPGTLDGGDVLRAGRRLFVGQTTRSNMQGTAQLRDALAPHGYTVDAVAVAGCLHLKSAVTAVSDDALLLNPAWVDPARFAGFECIAVDPAEPQAANALRVGDTLIHGATFPRTRRRLEQHDFRICPVDLSELAKAEGAVTCCSVILPL
jgi:dimethylargininase